MVPSTCDSPQRNGGEHHRTIPTENARGAIGNIEVKSKDKLIKKEIVLGTCSDVCHYDLEVSDIKLILKVTKTDGKVYQSQKTLEL